MDLPIDIHNELAELAERYNITVTMLVSRLIKIELIKDRQIHGVPYDNADDDIDVTV